MLLEVAMSLNCYLRDGIVYIVSQAKIVTGGYLSVDPVAVVRLSDNVELASVLSRMMRRPVPTVPLPSSSVDRVHPVLKHTPFKTLNSFKRRAILWTITKSGDVYLIDGWKKYSKGGYSYDNSRSERLPEGTELDVAVQRLIDLLNEDALRL